MKGETPDYAEEDAHIIRRLGWAAVKQWNLLPAQAREQIILQAGMVDDEYENVQLDQQIRAFLRKHAPDA